MTGGVGRLLPLQLDVTDRAADFAAVEQAHQHFGRLSIVVNNAGYGAFPLVGAYHASKWALEGLSQSLAQEVADSASRSR